MFSQWAFIRTDLKLYSAKVEAFKLLIAPQCPHRLANRRRRILRNEEEGQIEKRGWTLDVLQVVQSLVKEREQKGRACLRSQAEARPLHGEFSLAEVYAHADALARLHPANRHVEPKIRQQLQVLRDLGLVTFLGGGDYRLA